MRFLMLSQKLFGNVFKCSYPENYAISCISKTESVSISYLLLTIWYLDK